MRPDKDNRLTSMGIGEATCDRCITKLYSLENNSICDDCKLHTITHGDLDGFVSMLMKRKKNTLPDVLM
jgi:hypothetical protein